jgi:3-hydroxyacyl-CoA dehydrogenase
VARQSLELPFHDLSLFPPPTTINSLPRLTPTSLSFSRSIIQKSLTRIARKKHSEDSTAQQAFIDSVFSNLSTTTSAQSAVSSSDLVIEAIVENLSVKQELFRRLDELAPENTRFASNTSSLSITKIAEGVSQARKKRFAGFHAFNPVPQMKLVSSRNQVLSSVFFSEVAKLMM